MKPAALTVTAVIPMRNEAGHIAKCLESILNTSLPASELEILVVDGMSTDRSRDIVAECAAIHGSIRLLDNPAQIVPIGLNIGICEARGRVIVIIGAHCEYPQDYLLTCVQELQRTGADVVGGTLITNPGADTLVARGVALMTGHPFGVGGSAFRTGKAGGFVDTVPYGAYRRDVFERLDCSARSWSATRTLNSMRACARPAAGCIYLRSFASTISTFQASAVW